VIVVAARVVGAMILVAMILVAVRGFIGMTGLSPMLFGRTALLLGTPLFHAGGAEVAHTAAEIAPAAEMAATAKVPATAAARKGVGAEAESAE
jgi:hypothetical protein